MELGTSGLVCILQSWTPPAAWKLLRDDLWEDFLNDLRGSGLLGVVWDILVVTMALGTSEAHFGTFKS